jgi:malonyl CoA-acyl carrier protein transacylase
MTATRPDSTAVLFPGQGSQVSGMREHVERARPELLERVIAEVGEDPFARVEDGTRFQQPAIFCAALASWGELELRPDAGAGHSLGELTALAAAGALAEPDALRLVCLRGRLMDEVPEPGGMLAVLARDDPDAPARLAAAHGLTVANDNAPGQVVLSGRVDDVQAARRAAKEQGLRAVRLPVGGAFHSPLMAPAVEGFRAALRQVEVRPPRFPVLSCTTAAPFADVREELAQALVRPVRWRDTLEALRAMGIARFVETAPGSVLTGLVRRTLPGVEALPAGELEAVHG